MQCVGGVFNSWALACEFSLYCDSHPIREVLVRVFLFQFFFKLRRPHGQDLGIPSPEPSLCVGGTEYNRVARSLVNCFTTKVALNRFHATARFYELHTHWRNVHVDNLYARPHAMQNTPLCTQRPPVCGQARLHKPFEPSKAD